MKFSLYGKKTIEVVRTNNEWQAFYLGNEAKKRKADDIVIPASMKEQNIKEHLEDIFHEMATLKNNEIIRL